MSFELTQTVQRNARIVTINGEFDLAATPDVKPVLDRASSDPERVLVLDLTACTFLDSTAIALVVGASRALINGQSKIAIAATPESDVRAMFRLTGIDQTIPVVATVPDALDAALAAD